MGIFRNESPEEAIERLFNEKQRKIKEEIIPYEKNEALKNPSNTQYSYLLPQISGKIKELVNINNNIQKELEQIKKKIKQGNNKLLDQKLKGLEESLSDNNKKYKEWAKNLQKSAKDIQKIKQNEHISINNALTNGTLTLGVFQTNLNEELEDFKFIKSKLPQKESKNEQGA